MLEQSLSREMPTAEDKGACSNFGAEGGSNAHKLQKNIR
jgi:hypothetical protein